MNKKEYTDFGRKGAVIRWSNYRGHLVEELRKLTTKNELDFYLSTNPSHSELNRVLMELRKNKDVASHK